MTSELDDALICFAVGSASSIERATLICGRWLDLETLRPTSEGRARAYLLGCTRVGEHLADDVRAALAKLAS